jgi:hypothetical protein
MQCDNDYLWMGLFRNVNLMSFMDSNGCGVKAKMNSFFMMDHLMPMEMFILVMLSIR